MLCVAPDNPTGDACVCGDCIDRGACSQVFSAMYGVAEYEMHALAEVLQTEYMV